MLIIERLIALYAPHTCVGCGAEADALLCGACSLTVPLIPSRCYRCRAVTRDFAVCTNCRKYTPLRHVYVATVYDGPAKELLHRVKYERGRSGVADMGVLMSHLYPLLSSTAMIVPVPTASSRVRQRGYDQAELLARMISKDTGHTVLPALARMGQAHQVGAGRRERLKHLEDAFRATHPEQIRGAHCVLVDDVLTTGATIETAAKVLRKAGVRQVDALIFCQTN
jgi:ComF family protein